jgi:hypothetical protein
MNLICFYAVLHRRLQSNDPLPDELDEQLAELLEHDHALPPAFAFPIEDYTKGMFFMYKLIMHLCF